MHQNRKQKTNLNFPTLDNELECKEKGYYPIAGVDEVGRGCLAGPVVASAVILSFDNIPEGINDSKKLSPKRRKILSDLIKDAAISFGIGFCSPEEIDCINILQASRLAMYRAVEKLNPIPGVLLIDGRDRIDCTFKQRSIVHGDQISVFIAAASIVAKVFRDEWMIKFDEQYPGYNFAGHKGYGSREHRKFLQEKGSSPIHRKSFNWTPV